MNRVKLDTMPAALRLLADQITPPHDVPETCLRDAARMIEKLRTIVADAVRRPLGVVPDSAGWLTDAELKQAELRRTAKPKGGAR